MKHLTDADANVVYSYINQNWHDFVDHCETGRRANEIAEQLTVKLTPQEEKAVEGVAGANMQLAYEKQVGDALAMLNLLGYQWTHEKGWYVPPSPRELFIELVSTLPIAGQGCIGKAAAAEIWDTGYGCLPGESEHD